MGIARRKKLLREQGLLPEQVPVVPSPEMVTTTLISEDGTVMRKLDRYVLYNPATDDYFLKVENAGDFRKLLWSRTPEGAVRYRTLTEAKTVATKMVRSDGNRQSLYICELLESQTQLGVNKVDEVHAKKQA